jgi:hypothetical protein
MGLNLQPVGSAGLDGRMTAESLVRWRGRISLNPRRPGFPIKGQCSKQEEVRSLLCIRHAL